jgi:hypothetical protein
VGRYDRQLGDDAQGEHLHQKGFCQALSTRPELKDQNESRPDLQRCFELLRRPTLAPLVDLLCTAVQPTHNNDGNESGQHLFPSAKCGSGTGSGLPRMQGYQEPRPKDGWREWPKSFPNKLINKIAALIEQRCALTNKT